jgi:hypothetical protein
MAQVSRPFQIALGAILVLAVVWFVALRGSSSSGGGSGSAAHVSVPAPQPAQPSSAQPSSPYHGSAPGVEGLTRDIEKARGAVAQSERSAKDLEQKSAQASSPSTPSSSSSGAAAVGVAPRSSASSPTRHAVVPRPRHAAPSSHAQHQASISVPARQSQVEAQLKNGETVAVLFWDPKGSDDATVLRELRSVQDRSTVVQVASAGEVGSFGSFTRAAQVSTTPTILIVLPNGRTSTLTGLTDAYAIRQAISEAHQR